MTDLHAAAGEYLAIRRALGFKLRGHDRLLAEFIAFLTDTGSPTVTTTAALAWATRSPHLQSVRYAQRLSVVRGFAGYLHALDAAVEVPPLDLLSYRRQRRTPYLYAHAEVDALLAATDLLRPPLRAATYRGVFGLLAVTGMRVGEVIALDDGDVDRHAGRVTIREAKFGKHRRLPVHATTVTALRDYAQARAQLCTSPARAELLRLHSRHPADLSLRAHHVRAAADPRRDHRPGRRQRPDDPRAAAQLRGGHAAGLVPRRRRRRGEAPGPVGLHGSRPPGVHLLVPHRRPGPARPGGATPRTGGR